MTTVQRLPYCSKRAKAFVVLADNGDKLLVFRNQPIAILRFDNWLELMPGCSRSAIHYQTSFVSVYAPNVSMDTLYIMRANQLALNVETGDVSTQQRTFGI